MFFNDSHNLSPILYKRSTFCVWLLLISWLGLHASSCPLFQGWAGHNFFESYFDAGGNRDGLLAKCNTPRGVFSLHTTSPIVSFFLETWPLLFMSVIYSDTAKCSSEGQDQGFPLGYFSQANNGLDILRELRNALRGHSSIYGNSIVRVDRQSQTCFYYIVIYKG